MHAKGFAGVHDEPDLIARAPLPGGNRACPGASRPSKPVQTTGVLDVAEDYQMLKGELMKG